MEIRKVKIKDLIPAEYNPRKDLQPGDPEYNKLENSLEDFGYVEPIVWNERTGHIVGGHQKLKIILINTTVEEISVSVVNLSEHDEKILNIALNKIEGRWEPTKLKAILQELKDNEALELTGFEEWELEALCAEYDHISELLNQDFSDFAKKGDRDTFVMTFSLPAEEKDMIQDYLMNTENAKAELATAVVNKVKGLM